MISRTRQLLIGFTLLLTLTVPSAWAESYSLLTHTPVAGVAALNVSAADTQWLANKKVLKGGLRPTDFPPYGLRTINGEYEGMTADYLGMLEQQLGLSISLIPYANEDALWRALAQRFVYSAAVAAERPIFAVKTSERRVFPADMSGVRIAMPSSYLPLAQVCEKLIPRRAFKFTIPIRKRWVRWHSVRQKPTWATAIRLVATSLIIYALSAWQNCRNESWHL